MKNITLALLCCSTFLVACDNSDNTDVGKESSLLDKARSESSETTNSLMEGTKESAASASNVEKEAATEAVTSGKGLKEDAVESSSAAVESVKETASVAIKDNDTVVAAVAVSDNAEGESTYKKHCVACHSTGVAGSPKLGDQAAWGSRITQGNAVLTQHAIEGYKGETGYMPPKGGFMSLSDEEISMAVMYMVSKVQ
jgi:cytochrome c5